MRSEADFLGRPVASLQQMLRELSFTYLVIPRLAVDGVFGEETLEAVMVFQREFFPPVTGVVTNEVWDAVVSRYFQVIDQSRPPRPVCGFPNGPCQIVPGEHSVHLLMVQAMFKALSGLLDDVADGVVDGLHTGASVQNTRWLQQLLQLEPTGVMGRAEWDGLARLYDLFLGRTGGTPSQSARG